MEHQLVILVGEANPVNASSVRGDLPRQGALVFFFS